MAITIDFMCCRRKHTELTPNPSRTDVLYLSSCTLYKIQEMSKSTMLGQVRFVLAILNVLLLCWLNFICSAGFLLIYWLCLYLFCCCWLASPCWVLSVVALYDSFAMETFVPAIFLSHPSLSLHSIGFHCSPVNSLVSPFPIPFGITV